MNQVSEQQVNQRFNIASIGSSAPKALKTNDDKGHNLEMPIINYPPEEWHQLSSAQKSSMQKHQSQDTSAEQGHGGDCKHNCSKLLAQGYNPPGQ